MLAPGVYAWVDPQPGVGRPNAGCVVDEDGVTVVDTLMVPSQAGPFGDEVDALGHPVRRVVLTSGHIEFAGGTARFRLAAFYGSRLTSDHLDEPPNIPAYQRFMPDFAAEFEGLETRPITHLVDEPAMLTPAVEVVPVAGYTPQNLLAVVPAAGVAFAGGMCSFGVTPLCFQGHPAVWADTLEALPDLAEVIVPGHGRPGGDPEVRALQGYLRACVAAHGHPDRIPTGPWDTWSERHLDAINVERAAMLARGEDGIPPTMLRAIGLA